MPSKPRVVHEKKEAQQHFEAFLAVIPRQTNTEVNADPMSDAPGPNRLKADTKPAANQSTPVEPTDIKTLLTKPGSNETQEYLGISYTD